MVDITKIIVAIISVIGTILASLITAHLVPWLESKLTANQIVTVGKFIYSGVKAAETLFPEAGSGAKKFQYVLDSAKTFCESQNITFDETAIKNEIQAVWDDLYNKANPLATEVKAAK